MRNPTDEEITERLVGIISDGFNRALGALETARAIEAKTMHQHYKGIGSKYYDLVTEQFELTAKFGAPVVRRLFLGDGDSPDSK
jgi:hypothetical protein